MQPLVAAPIGLADAQLTAEAMGDELALLDKAADFFSEHCQCSAVCATVPKGLS